MILIRIKRLVASLIDFMVISFVILIPANLITGLNYNIRIEFLELNPIQNSTNISLLMWIIFFTLIIFKDVFFYQSLGKKVMKIAIYKKDAILKNSLIIIFRNLLSAIFISFYPITIIFFGKSIGDIVFRTHVKNIEVDNPKIV